MFDNLHENHQAVALFEDRYGSLSRGCSLGDLVELLFRFANLPYENLSKIIAWNGGATSPKLRCPLQVVEDHLNLGTGGTCFSLTECLRLLAKTMGFNCYPVMAHMRHGANIHCALRVEAAGNVFLVDPGYLVQQPLKLSTHHFSVKKPERLGEPILVPAGQWEGVPPETPPGDFDLFTFEIEGPRWRYRFSDQPPSEAAFLTFWEQSFLQPAMCSLIATRRTEGGEFYYLHNHKLRQQQAEAKKTLNVRTELERSVKDAFGISPEITRQAAEIINRLRRAAKE